MTTLTKLSLVLAALGALTVSSAAAQVRGVVGAGIGVPVGDFADVTGGDAQTGGGTALAGLEWLVPDQNFGFRLDGAYNRFCTGACDEAGGDLDVHYRFWNANLNAILEFPMGGATDLRPYLLAGVGYYNYKLAGDDAPSGLESESDFGLNGGAGITFALGRIGVFAEGRFHNVLAEGNDLQYIPIVVGARINLR